MNELALFAGAGGGILGGKLLGWRTVCAVEWEPYPASVLCARQNDKILETFPIWDDVQTFDGHPWRGVVDVISGGFPCQDISAAGKGDGLDGERSGMWKHMARLVGEVRPRFVFVENSPMLTSRGGTRVIADLTALGYDTRWTVMGAADVGAPHQRDRIWIVGKMGNSNNYGHTSTEIRESTTKGSHTGSSRQEQASQFERSSEQHEKLAHSIDQGLWSCSRGDGGEPDFQDRGGSDNQRRSRADVESAKTGKSSDLEKEVFDSEYKGLEGHWNDTGEQEIAKLGNSSWWASEPNVGRVAHGVASRVDRLKAIGNGQVPLCAAEAFRLLAGAFN